MRAAELGVWCVPDSHNVIIVSGPWVFSWAGSLTQNEFFSVFIFLEKLLMTEGQSRQIVIYKQFCLLTMGTVFRFRDFAEIDTPSLPDFLITLI